MSSKFLDAIVEFRSTSEVEAYDKKVSKWLEEAKKGGFAEQLLDEMIFYAKKIEEEREKESQAVKSNSEPAKPDGSRSIFLK